MRDTRFDSRSSEWIGDLTVWKRQNDPDNAEQLDRLRRNLRQARKQELTPRQQQVLTLYYDRRLTIPQIAGQLGVNRSTVSRTVSAVRTLTVLRIFPLRFFSRPHIIGSRWASYILNLLGRAYHAVQYSA